MRVKMTYFDMFLEIICIICMICPFMLLIFFSSEHVAEAVIENGDPSNSGQKELMPYYKLFQIPIMIVLVFLSLTILNIFPEKFLKIDVY